MEENDEPKQLKLGGKGEDELGGRKKKKEKEEKANKLVLLFILLVTVVASLVFYAWPRIKNRSSGVRDQNSGGEVNPGFWGKPKVIEF